MVRLHFNSYLPAAYLAVSFVRVFKNIFTALHKLKTFAVQFFAVWRNLFYNISKIVGGELNLSFQTGVILILLAAAAWGLGGVSGQYLYQYHDVTATWLIAVRQVLAGIIFLGYLILRGENIFRIFADKRDAKDQLAFSFLGLFGAQFGFYYTISLCNAATATVLQYTSPVFVMLWMSFKKRRLPEGREFLGIIFALVGVFLISTHGDVNNVVLSPLALGIGLISAVSLAFYTVQPMCLLQKYSTTLVVGWGQFLSGLFLCCFVNPFEPTGHWDAAALAAFAYLVIGATVLSYSVFLVGLKVVGATKASLISCAEPLASIIAVVVWLKTPLTPIDLAGMACIILTVVLLSLPKK